jgi:hypothetical protein
MRKCRSRSQYGDCWLSSKHDGEHAVPIGDDLWFAYPRPRTDGFLGYAVFCGDRLAAAPHYCDHHCPECGCGNCRADALTPARLDAGTDTTDTEGGR